MTVTNTAIACNLGWSAKLPPSAIHSDTYRSFWTSDASVGPSLCPETHFRCGSISNFLLLLPLQSLESSERVFLRVELDPVDATIPRPARRKWRAVPPKSLVRRYQEQRLSKIVESKIWSVTIGQHMASQCS